MKKAQTRSKQVNRAKEEIEASAKPLMTETSTASAVARPTRSRRNKAGHIERTDRFSNIESGLVPFNYSTTGYGGKTSNIDIRDTVMLCQKAYYNFAVFRNAIDLMTEFSISKLFMRGGSKKSQVFFQAFFDKIDVLSLMDRFFREYYRSGNVFIYRYDGTINKKDVNKMSQTFGISKANTKYSIPLRYSILNPADIQVGGNISFANSQYYKLVNGYELERLRNPRTPEDKDVHDSLPQEIQDQIKNKSANITLPLEQEKINAVFYKKQDYEPFAVPMGYPVLDDINWKAEMKKMDMAVARTMQQTILLVTMGTEPEKGGVNQKNLAAMQDLFTNQSVGRVLIADYTTKAQFVIPEVASILDAKKYEVVNKDIELGLGSIITGGGEKFANQSVKVEMFMAKLKQAREAFLSQFLLPEIKRVAKSLGFKNYPTPYFHKLSLRNDDVMSRIYARLIEMGILTPEEGMQALDTGRLPTNEESVESQEELLKLKEKGFYEPMVGGPQTQMELADKQADVQIEMQDKSLKTQEKINTEKVKQAEKSAKQGGAVPPKKPSEQAGRPSGTSSPQTTKKVSPIGANEEAFSMLKVKDNFIMADKLYKRVVSSIKRKHKIKELNNDQEGIAFEIAKQIVANEDPADWNKKVKNYLKNPIDTNPERIAKIQKISYEHQVDDYLASILYISKV
tara:strand:+ start:14923 stop:16968 length:2046 start_codon:yes stop_codon:yes gene_type:complete